MVFMQQDVVNKCLSGCTSLTSISAPLFPNLRVHDNDKQARDESCEEMFMGCSKLSSVVSNLLFGTNNPGKITHVLNNAFKNMFRDCVSLTNIPVESLNELTYTKSNGCLSMFENCTSLTDISGLKLKIKSADKWSPANTYENMFKGCTKLKTIPSDLFNNKTTYTYMCKNMFNGCTSLTDVNHISMPTTLATNCFEGMFANCSKLTTVTQINTTSIPNYACFKMFENCISLKTAEVFIDNYLTCSTGCCEAMFRRMYKT
jgi:hypothetical protein